MEFDTGIKLMAEKIIDVFISDLLIKQAVFQNDFIRLKLVSKGIPAFIYKNQIRVDYGFLTTMNIYPENNKLFRWLNKDGK